MTDLRNQVFYRTDTEVRTGDEFYHIALTYHPELKEPPFRVQVIHGFAGKPPITPEDQESFESREAADGKFDRWMADLAGKGFRPYSRSVHGFDKGQGFK
jgi:hypothetical protein